MCPCPITRLSTADVALISPPRYYGWEIIKAKPPDKNLGSEGALQSNIEETLFTPEKAVLQEAP